MAHRFKKHYTLAEARAMMPRVREWLDSMVQLRHEYATISKRVDNMMSAQSDVRDDSLNRSNKNHTQNQTSRVAFKQHVIINKAAEPSKIACPSRRGPR